MLDTDTPIGYVIVHPDVARDPELVKHLWPYSVLVLERVDGPAVPLAEWLASHQ